MKNQFNTLHRINQMFYFTTLALYLTIILGMYFQFVLGIAQLLLAISLIFKYNKLSKTAQKWIKLYWIIVLSWFVISFLLYIYGNQYNFPKEYFFIWLFFFPMGIATYFVFLTAKLKKEFK